MALDPVLSSLSFSTDADTATITDNTVYGGANPARNITAVYLELWKMDKNGDDTPVVVSNALPETVTSWTFDSSLDGWYKARIYLIPEFDVLTSYDENDVVYYNGILYRAVQTTLGNLPTNATYFAIIDLEDTAIDGNNVIAEYKDYLVIEHGKMCAAKATAAWYKDKDCSNCNKQDLLASFLQKRGMVIAAEVFAYTLNLYNKAEDIARKLENACESC